MRRSLARFHHVVFVFVSGALTEVEGHRGVVVRFPVGDEVDLVLPLLLLQPVFCAAVVTHTAAAQDEDDGPDQPEPCRGGGETPQLSSLGCEDVLILRHNNASATRQLDDAHANLGMCEKISIAA